MDLGGEVESMEKVKRRSLDELLQKLSIFDTPAFWLSIRKASRKARTNRLLDLSDRQLDRIPREDLKPENATKYGILKLSDNPALQITEEIKNFDKLQELQASGCGIKRLPAELSSIKSLCKLCLSNNPWLKTFPEVVLSLGSLKELNLGQCDLQEVPKEITKLSELEKLHLRGNRRVRQIPVEVFSLIALKELNVGQCGLTKLPHEISQLKHLEKLHLFGNTRLRSMPASVFLLPSLRELNAGCCGLTDLPIDIAKLEKLASLNLRQNWDLKQIPASVFAVSSLKELSVARCGLSEIPADIAKLTKLEKLHVFGNKELKTLPDALYGLTQLRELNACYCSLQSLGHIGRLTKLENLHLRGNEDLRQLPRDVRTLTQLRELNMGFCGLVVIPPDISQLTKLKKVHLFDNPNLDDLPSSLSLPAGLEELSLSNCGLLSKGDGRFIMGEGLLPLGSFDKLKKLHLRGCSRLQRNFRDISSMAALKEVDLSNCSLTLLPFTTERLDELVKVELGSNNLQPQELGKIFKLKKLQELGISNCGLTEIPDLGDLATRLRKLDVHGNAIKGISPIVFRQLDHLQELNLAGCELAEIPEEISELKHLIVLNLSDNQLSGLPESFSGLTLIEVLDISCNADIAQLPSVVTALTKLKTLDFSCCCISELPVDMEKLSELESLAVQNIGLQSYPTVLLRLKNLLRLDLSNRTGLDKARNNVSELPAKLVDTLLEELLLNGNPMSKPPSEICDQGMLAIRSYLTDIIPGSRLISAETVNMLGDTGAGKTSIVRSLLNRRPCTTDDADRTRVMDQVTVQLLNEEFVNINDFGGHEIYQTVLPMFLPPKGIGILAYNMEEDVKSQLDKVSKWIITLIAKSPGIRLIVAGTHADLVAEHDRLDSKSKVMQLAEDKFKAAAEDVESHLEDLKAELHFLKRNNKPVDRTNDKLKFLEETSSALQSSSKNILFVSLSCKEGADNTGLNSLHEVISKNIKPPDPLPASWYLVMKDILHPPEAFLQAASYLKWEQVEGIVQRHLPGESDDDKLKTILRYLVATSQIIWLDGHHELGKFVFHRISHVLDMCKAVLHHSECSVPPKREKDAQLYAGGRLTGSFLQHLLKSYNGDMADIVTSLMLKFNLISRVSDDGSSSEEFIVPSNLKDGAPACLPSPLACRGPLPTVLVGLRFFTSTIPLALFETSLASVLSWMHKCKIDPDCWKHGIQCRANKVTLSYQRIEDRLEIKASAEAPRNLWEVLHPVLRAIGEHVINMWKGAMPKCTFACPGCRCCGVHDQDRSPNVRDNVTLEELIASDRPMYDWYCDSCRMDIPRILVFPRLQELITDKDCKEVADFIERLSKFNVCGKLQTIKNAAKD